MIPYLKSPWRVTARIDPCEFRFGKGAKRNRMTAIMETSERQPLRIVDLDAALRRMGGNEELLGTLVQFFFEDSPELMRRIREGSARNDTEAVRLASHRLCGLSLNFGAETAVAAARRLEELAIANECGELGAAVAALEREIELVTQALAGRRVGLPPSDCV
jgi:HPt (histidine-containing phosphotransfer) domain-containing protein